MIGISSAKQAYIAASLFGFGIGGILTLLPIAWADYFGRANFAAIRSVALSAQVIAQAAGPLLSGALHDWTGTYERSLQCFVVLSGLSGADGAPPDFHRERQTGHRQSPRERSRVIRPLAVGCLQAQADPLSCSEPPWEA
jgi:MFS family permease